MSNVVNEYFLEACMYLANPMNDTLTKGVTPNDGFFLFAWTFAPFFYNEF